MDLIEPGRGRFPGTVAVVEVHDLARESALLLPGVERAVRETLLHDRFDPEGRLVTSYGAENSQFFVDRRRLAERGLTLEQLRDAVQALPFVFAAFTEDEVRAAASRLE